MSIVVKLTLKAKDETYDQLVSTMKAILPDTAARDGAELISCAADPESKTVLIYEVWTDKASQESYLAWRAERGELDAMGAMLAEPPSFEDMEHVF